MYAMFILIISGCNWMWACCHFERLSVLRIPSSLGVDRQDDQWRGVNENGVPTLDMPRLRSQRTQSNLGIGCYDSVVTHECYHKRPHPFFSTKKPSLDRQLDRITAYQGSVLWSKFSDRCLPATTASYILSRNSPRGLFLDSIYRTTTIPLTWFLFFGCIFSCLCLQVWCWHSKRLLCISCRCRFFVALFAISVFMANVHVMLLSAIRSIFLLWILRFSGLKVTAPPGGYSWI